MSGAVKGQTGIGTFTITEVSNGWGKLKSGAGWIYLVNTSYCTIGSTVSNSTASSTSEVSYMVKVTITDLNIRVGPGIDYAKTGKQTGKGTFTIVEESIGEGSTMAGACLRHIRVLEKDGFLLTMPQRCKLNTRKCIGLQVFFREYLQAFFVSGGRGLNFSVVSRRTEETNKMQVAKLTAVMEQSPVARKHLFTEEQLQNEFDYILAEKFTKNLLKKRSDIRE